MNRPLQRTTGAPALARLRAPTVIAIVALAVAGGGCGGKDGADGAATTANARVAVSAELSGAAVEPTSAPDAHGSAVIDLLQKTGKACWRLSVGMIEKPLSAHVHKAQRQGVGPVVIPLGARFARNGCVLVPKASLREVAASPASFYVDIHTQPHLDGAMRGQLRADSS